MPQAAAAKTRTRKRGAGRNEILKAALAEFSTKGFAGATTAGIARRAGVTQPLVHHHFKSKKKLWMALLDDIYEDFADIMGRAATDSAPADPYQQMALEIRAFVHFTQTHSEFSRIVILESIAGGWTYDYLFEKYLKPELVLLQSSLDAATELGVIRAFDRDLLPFLIVGSVVHPFVVPETPRRLAGIEPPEMAQRYGELLAKVLLKGLR